MGRRGPAPEPTHLKLLKGNPGKRALNKEEPKPDRGKLTAPAWLNRAAKLEWRRVVKHLDELGMSTDFDRSMLATYCQAYSRLQELEKIVEELGFTFTTEKGYVCQRPEFGMAQRQATLVRGLASEFGMSPSSRTRVRAPTKKDAPSSRKKRFFGDSGRAHA